MGIYRIVQETAQFGFTDLPPVSLSKVDMSKVNLDVIKPWITQKITEILKFEDDVVIEFCFNLLEKNQVHQNCNDYVVHKMVLTSLWCCMSGSFVVWGYPWKSCRC